MNSLSPFLKRVAFDFDGTITTQDTFLLFIRFCRGDLFLVRALLLNSPYLIAYKLGLYPNWKAKQRLFAFCFKGVSAAEFEGWCRDFSAEIETVVRPLVMQKIRLYQQEGATVLIVSASPEAWIKPWAEKQGIPVVLATKLELDSEQKLTGHLEGRNCYGEEKVNRIRQAYPDRVGYTLIAYGDSAGDKEMLAFADEGWLLNKHIKFEKAH